MNTWRLRINHERWHSSGDAKQLPDVRPFHPGIQLCTLHSSLLSVLALFYAANVRAVESQNKLPRGWAGHELSMSWVCGVVAVLLDASAVSAQARNRVNISPLMVAAETGARAAHELSMSWVPGNLFACRRLIAKEAAVSALIWWSFIAVIASYTNQ